MAAMQTLQKLNPSEKSSVNIKYLRDKYHTSEYQLDTYPLFIEKSHLIVKSSGYIGLIVPSAWVASNYDKSLRKLVGSETTITNVVIAPKNTFINTLYDEPYVKLDFKSRWKGESAWTDIQQTFQLTNIPCRFGGKKWFFICSFNKCGKVSMQISINS